MRLLLSAATAWLLLLAAVSINLSCSQECSGGRLTFTRAPPDNQNQITLTGCNSGFSPSYTYPNGTTVSSSFSVTPESEGIYRCTARTFSRTSGHLVDVRGCTVIMPTPLDPYPDEKYISSNWGSSPILNCSFRSGVYPDGYRKDWRAHIFFSESELTVVRNNSPSYMLDSSSENLTVTGFHPLLVGSYWCQTQLRSSNGEFRLSSRIRLTISPKEGENYFIVGPQPSPQILVSNSSSQNSAIFSCTASVTGGDQYIVLRLFNDILSVITPECVVVDHTRLQCTDVALGNATVTAWCDYSTPYEIHCNFIIDLPVNQTLSMFTCSIMNSTDELVNSKSTGSGTGLTTDIITIAVTESIDRTSMYTDLTTTAIDPVFTDIGNATITTTPHFAIYISVSATVLLISTTAAVVLLLLLYKKKRTLKKNENFNNHNHNYRLSLPVDNGNDLPADDNDLSQISTLPVYNGNDLPADDNNISQLQISTLPVDNENDLPPDDNDLSQLQISTSHLKLLNCIGQGEFGLVYMGHYYSCDNTYTCVAVKTLKHGCYHEAEELLAESQQMLKLHHPNVMPLIGVCLDAGPVPYIVLPYMAGGCLQSLLKQRRSELMIDEDASESVIVNVRNQLLSMCFQVAKGMEYIAQNKLVHRDLAARNCMIDNNGTIKVSDFGLSKSLYTKTYMRLDLYSKEVKLPIKWLAIESIQDGVFSEKTDVWSFGVTCWEIFSGGMIPYGGLGPIEIMRLLVEEERRLPPPLNAACNSEIYNTIMYQCWLTSSSHRPSFSQLVVAIGNILTLSADYLDLNSLRESLI